MCVSCAVYVRVLPSGVGIKLQIADYWAGVEIEAPLDGSTPVEIHGSATIDGILIGPPNSLVNGKGSHYEALIKVDTDAAGPWGLPNGWVRLPARLPACLHSCLHSCLNSLRKQLACLRFNLHAYPNRA